MEISDVHKMLEQFGQLPLEDKEYVAEVIQKQLIDAKRRTLAVRVQEAKDNYNQGHIKRGTLRNLLEDLEGD